jgi:hypothetical protein
MELPAGAHEILIQPVDHAQLPCGAAVSQPVHVDDGRDTFVVLRVHDTGLAGSPLTSAP